MPNNLSADVGVAKWIALATVVLGVAVILAITMISIMSPGNDVLTLAAIFTAFATTTLVGLFAALKSAENTKKIDVLSVKVDGRLTELLAVSNRAERAEGRADGVAEGNRQQRQD